MPQGIRPSTKVVEERIKKQMPEVSNVPITNLGLLSRLKESPGQEILGMYNPFTGNVEMNPSLAGSQDYEDTLVHELTHARQRQQQGLLENIIQGITGEGESYNRRPSELEARQAEIDNRIRQKKSTEYMIRPSWDQPSKGPMKFISRGDINLR